MPYRKILPAALTLLLLVPAIGIRSAEQTLIPAGSAWKYNDSGSNLGTAWRAAAYDDASWPLGLAELGYGDGDESTVLSYGGNTTNRRITYYFRRSFNVADPASVGALTLRYVRDDGCIIYVNGVEVVRSNMPTGTVSYTTRATAAIADADETAWLQAPIDPALLVRGTNVIAVELHQSSPTSSDISFNLELRDTEAQAGDPSVTLTAPANQSLSNVSAVTFNASVFSAAGLASATLYVGQEPIETVPLAGQSAEVSFSTDLPIGQTYYWNVQITDWDGQQTLAPSDFELTVDASAPDAPVLQSPADGSTGVATSPALSAVVSDPAGGSLNVSVALRQPAAPEFTIVALPDTQHYSEAFPSIFASQTQWIVNNKDARNIVFVTHEGDIVEHNNLTSEWLVADASMSMLDGVVPYGMGPGNHDQPTTLFNQFFPYTRYQGLPWYGGHYQNLNDNNYQLFSGGGLDFVIVHLAYCPPAAALSWASSVIKSYPDRIGMMTTHAYLGLGAVRSTHGCGSTQYIWDQLAVQTPNLHFMLSGHVSGESRRADIMNGHPVFQMLADYQNLPSGGEGWLRILRFVPADSKIHVQTYSPWLNRYDTDADSEFTLDFPMGGAFAPAGTTTAASGSTATVPISDLAPNTQYEWRMTVTNSSGKSRTGPVWSFTTGAGGPINHPPIALDQSVNAVEDTGAALRLTAFDANDDQVTFTVVSSPSWGTLSGKLPALLYTPAPNFNGTDSFTFQANDGKATSNTATVSITVQAVNDPPVASGESYIVQAGQTLVVSAPGVLGNDADVDGTPLMAQLLVAATRGPMTLSANGSLTYTPSAGYSGSDSFLYRVTDGQLASAPAVVSISVLGDTTAPSTIMTAPAPGATVSGNVTVSANASDNVGVLGVQFLLNGAPFGVEDTAAPYSVTWSSTGVTDGAYQLSARARDAAGNQSTAAAVTVTVYNTIPVPPVPTGLVASYSFNEGSGSTLNDRAGKGHAGTISGAAWTTQGKYGGALSFDGINDWVTVNDTAALDLTTGMTLEAWVRPSSLSDWRTVLLKQGSGGLTYSLYASNDDSLPESDIYVGGDKMAGAPEALLLNAWSHLAATYDGTRLRLYVNGVEVGSRSLSGAMATSTGVLRIGGNSVWDEFFEGGIDEIRIYNRALTPAEILADMVTPINP
jgi:hypothetical protein